MNVKLSVKNWIQVGWYTNKLQVLIGPLLLILLWTWLTWSGLVNPLFLSRPEDTFSKMVELLRGEIWPDLFSTIKRALIGFLIASLLAIPLGVLLGLSAKLYKSVEVIIDFFRSLPSTALFPLFLLVFGIGNMAKIAVAVFVCFWIILISTANGVIHSSKTRYKALKILGANKRQIITTVTIWEALPYIATGLRVAFSIALIVIVVTEMFIGTNNGLGQRIYDSYLTYRIAELYAILVLVGLLGYTINKMFILGERKLIHWTGR